MPKCSSLLCFQIIVISSTSRPYPSTKKRLILPGMAKAGPIFPLSLNSSAYPPFFRMLLCVIPNGLDHWFQTLGTFLLIRLPFCHKNRMSEQHILIIPSCLLRKDNPVLLFHSSSPCTTCLHVYSDRSMAVRVSYTGRTLTPVSLLRKGLIQGARGLEKERSSSQWALFSQTLGP